MDAGTYFYGDVTEGPSVVKIMWQSETWEGYAQTLGVKLNTLRDQSFVMTGSKLVVLDNGWVNATLYARPVGGAGLKTTEPADVTNKGLPAWAWAAIIAGGAVVILMLLAAAFAKGK